MNLFDHKWYRYLLLFSAALGVVGAIGAIAYNVVTNFGVDLFFGNAGTELWSGEWWWIPFTAIGGLLIAVIRRGWKVPKDVPGGVATVSNGWVDPKSAMELVAIAALSAIFGASLGPSFGLILFGGAAGGWLIAKLKLDKSKDAKNQYALTGMAGSLGGAFTAPLLGTVLVSEMAPIKKKDYVAAFFPQLIAATAGFGIYYAVTGDTMIGLFGLPQFDYEPSQLVLAVALGLVAVVTLILFALITQSINKLAVKITDTRVRGLIGGALVGLLAFALPLTAGSGISQLKTVIESPTNWGIAFLLIVLVGKILGISISLASGFLGGNVFPVMFIGGVVGVIIHLIFPEIPIALAVAAMLAAVPGAFLQAPLSLTLIGAGMVGLTVMGMIPVAVALVVAHVAMNFIRWLVAQRKVSAQA